MLPVVLVLLVASSALAAPGVRLNQVSINDVVPPRNNGRIVNAFWTNQASEMYDGGDTVPYILTAQQVVNDLANLGDKQSQALAVAQSIGILGSLGHGTPGDACAAAEVIDTVVRATRSGNRAGIRSAVVNFIKSISASIDTIVTLAANPNALRFATGPRGNCNSAGRTYSFEAAWDSILANASPASAGLVNEQYCAAKRLYNAHSSRSNNAGAFITAASLAPVNGVFVEVLPEVANFVSAVASGNPQSAAASAKKALARAAQNCR